MRPEINDKLAKVIAKYRTHPQFLALDVTGNPNQRGAFDDTFLHIAAETNALEDMKVLIEAGADVSAKGDLGRTPLHGAAARGYLEAIRLLLAAGADPEIEDEYNQTPSRVAELMKKKEAVEFLRRHRAGPKPRHGRR